MTSIPIGTRWDPRTNKLLSQSDYNQLYYKPALNQFVRGFEYDCFILGEYEGLRIETFVYPDTPFNLPIDDLLLIIEARK